MSARTVRGRRRKVRRRGIGRRVPMRPQDGCLPCAVTCSTRWPRAFSEDVLVCRERLAVGSKRPSPEWPGPRRDRDGGRSRLVFVFAAVRTNFFGFAVPSDDRRRLRRVHCHADDLLPLERQISPGASGGEGRFHDGRGERGPGRGSGVYQRPRLPRRRHRLPVAHS